jgi:RNA polymerase sigma-70 factor, ECF subfamily
MSLRDEAGLSSFPIKRHGFWMADERGEEGSVFFRELFAHETEIADGGGMNPHRKLPMVMHATLNDEDLFGLVRAGDEDAFLTLYRRRQAGIYRFALRMTGSEAVAEDVTQEVFLTLIRGDGRYEAGRGSVSSYLYGVARNQVFKRFEKERGLLPMIEAEDERESFEGLRVCADPLGDLARRETIESVRQAVLALPPHYREAVVLCDLHEMSYAEAAVVLGCAVGTVRSRLHRARGMLAERLRGVAAGEPGLSTCVV